ncbi:MAG TPA: C13 family peptidase [Candidatus Thermoplasmatota archaeon]|nr:C13 family peptidase [Candidatus Thermoplasmatota archaeon]
MTTQALPTATNDEIGHSILKRLSYNDDAKILSYLWGPVSKGDIIQGTKETIFTAPSAGYAMYIDPSPEANLFHPVKYVFLAEPTQELQVFDARSPPLNFHDYKVIDTPYAQFFYSVQNRRASIPVTTSGISKSGIDSRYAVLMNGGYDEYNNHIRYWDDLSNIFVTLKYTYGFPQENIIVLCSDGLSTAPDQDNGQSSNPDLDGDGVNDIQYACTLANVDLVFTNLAANFTFDDKLFVFTTDHGDTQGGWNTVECLWNYETLTDSHFASLLAAFPDCEKICTLEPCFSGGFLDNVVVPPGPIVASSACRYDEYSYAMGDLNYDEYVFYWTAAMTGQDAYGNPVNADADGNGIITMDEAYQYALAHDQQPEHPQYGETPDGTGSQLSLLVGSNPPEKPSTPVGKTTVCWDRMYNYTSSTSDPDGDQVYYLFNWGDGTNSGWLGPYSSGQTATGSHDWPTLGDFNLTVRARDSWGAMSPASDPLQVSVKNDTPPFPPTITGPTQVKPHVTYTYILNATSEFNNALLYDIDWGDGNGASGIGPYHSGQAVNLTHIWKMKGTYIIKARATDIYGMQGDWSTIQVVAPMPAMYQFSFDAFLQHLFERFPHMFPILRHLMGY